MSDNSVSLALPVKGFTNVARLVTAGFVSQLPLGFEAVDDVQLAVELILRSLPATGGRVKIALASDAGGLTLTVGDFEQGSAERSLEEIVHEGLGLGAYLGRLVDSVEIVDNGSPAVVLRKKLEVSLA